jgi:hypothetical protein
MSAVQEFPVDLPGDPIDRAPALMWTAITLGIATLSLALTNAFSIESWGADLPPSAAVARVVDEAGYWRATTDRLGFGAPRATMRRIWTQTEQARWPGRRATEMAQR